MIRSTSSYWKWKVLVELRRRGVERVPLQNLSPLPFPLSLFRSFSVSPLPKFNMAPKQTFHRDYEDRQLRRLLQSSLELIGLLYHSQALAGFFLAASKDGVVACTREILEFLHSFLSQRYIFVNKLQEQVDCTRKEFSLKSETTTRDSKPQEKSRSCPPQVQSRRHQYPRSKAREKF